MILPEYFLQDMKHLLGEDFDSYLRAMEENAHAGIRINRIKVDGRFDENILNNIGLDSGAERVSWTDNGYYLPLDNHVTHHPYYAAGLYYIQEPSAMSPAAYLPVKKTDIVLDLCAAPGGKATELASKCGFLFANDISASRARILLKNLELSGAYNYAVTAETPEKLSEVYPEFFDAILVDAPCSGEGMFRKDNSLIKSYENKGPSAYHEMQVPILESAVKLLKPGGYLLFSTCTFSPVENENTLKQVMEKYPELKLVDLPNRSIFFEKGLDCYDKAARLYPHKLKGEGHFLSLLKKDDNNTTCHIDDTVNTEIEYENVRIGDMLIYRPKNISFKKGLRFLRTGLLKGEYLKKGKTETFVPSNAMALCGIENEFDCSIDFCSNDERVIKYLKGESIFVDNNEISSASKGYCLMKVDGFPFAAGRIINGRIKNIYPQGLIWQ